jgi:hypothetical protein
VVVILAGARQHASDAIVFDLASLASRILALPSEMRADEAHR